MWFSVSFKLFVWYLLLSAQSFQCLLLQVCADSFLITNTHWLVHFSLLYVQNQVIICFLFLIISDMSGDSNLSSGNISTEHSGKDKADTASVQSSDSEFYWSVVHLDQDVLIQFTHEELCPCLDQWSLVFHHWPVTWLLCGCVCCSAVYLVDVNEVLPFVLEAEQSWCLLCAEYVFLCKEELFLNEWICFYCICSDWLIDWLCACLHMRDKGDIFICDLIKSCCCHIQNNTCDIDVAFCLFCWRLLFSFPNM